MLANIHKSCSKKVYLKVKKVAK